MLLLDEADSFLSERQSAKNSWEVTAVNEMLTQMERLRGALYRQHKFDATPRYRFTAPLRTQDQVRLSEA
jgi:transitional endoplasmic reticulum ATPase